MTALRIIALCISAALVCMSIRCSHPQIASAAAMAAGVGAILISMEDIGSLSRAAETFRSLGQDSMKEHVFLMKMCAIGLVAEFASDICTDAGEAALARRIDMGARIALTAAALPTLGRILEVLSKVLE